MESSERYWPDWNHGSKPNSGLMSRRFLTLAHGSTGRDGKRPRNEWQKSRKRAKPMRQSSDTKTDLILGWLSRLSKHFNTELTDEQIDIYVKALAKNGPGQISEAFEACLNHSEFFPRLSEVHKRMPDREPSGAWRYSQQEPLYELNHPFAVEVCLLMYGAHYDDLDPRSEAIKIMRVAFAATKLRYARMGINLETWKHGEPKQVDAKEFLRTVQFPDFKPFAQNRG
jgi:hypothetical protein